MRVRVLLFAGLREALDVAEVEVEAAEGATVGDLVADLVARYPALRELRFTTAVNRAYAQAARPLAAGDEVALIPPVSGG